MDLRTVLVLRPGDFKGGGLWVLVGLLFLAWMIIRADPGYRSSEDAAREFSIEFRQNKNRHLEPGEPNAPRYQQPRFRPQVDPWNRSVIFPALPIGMTGGPIPSATGSPDDSIYPQSFTTK